MTKRKIHFIGIGGVSQSKLALMLKSFGCEVSGSDVCESENVGVLKKCGINVFLNHSKKNINNADIVIYNGAISDDNEEFAEAVRKNKTLLSRSECLAEISALHHKIVAVSGCHGKTTTTALLNFALKNLNPQMHVGGDLIDEKFQVVKNKNLFVTEACEFKKSFLKLSPDIAVILNIDADHLDTYKNLDDIENTFLEFAKKVKASGFLIANADDFRCLRIMEKCERIISFGIKEKADVTAKSIEFCENGISFIPVIFGKEKRKIKVKLFGEHNVYNILAAICVAEVLNAKNYLAEIEKFNGVKRRMEFLGKQDGNIIIHDYAHHPTEIRASINALKLHFDKPIIAVFQPHTYSRTKSLWHEFSSCFSGAEKTFLTDIYAAREKPIENIESNNLAKEIENGFYASSEKELFEELKCISNSIIVFMGAGDIEKVAHSFQSN